MKPCCDTAGRCTFACGFIPEEETDPAGWIITYVDGSGAFAFTEEEADEAIADAESAGARPGATKQPVYHARSNP